jgi:hypothetical protein
MIGDGGLVECDEVYVVAGHKGNPAAMKAKKRKGRRNRLKGSRVRALLPALFSVLSAPSNS